MKALKFLLFIAVGFAILAPTAFGGDFQNNYNQQQTIVIPGRGMFFLERNGDTTTIVDPQGVLTPQRPKVEYRRQDTPINMTGPEHHLVYDPKSDRFLYVR